MAAPETLLPDTWYRLADVFDGPVAYLRDGSTVRYGSRFFQGAAIQMLTGRVIRYYYKTDPGPARRYLQINLQGVNPEDVARLPSLLTISRKLLREHVLFVSDSSYAYEILLKAGARIYSAKGDVCMNLILSDADQSADDIMRKVREVETAFQRGLLDQFGKSKADFRLHIKPMMRKLTALFDAQYLPDDAWRLDVVFGHWYDRNRDELVLPLSGETDEDETDPEDLEIRFRQLPPPREFKISDLFKKRSE